MSLKDLTPGNWTVDATHSEVGFTARHLMVSKVRGTFGEFTAEVNVAEQFENSTVRAEVTVNSIDTRNADRDTHLRSADFFEIEQHPSMTFTSTSVTPDSMTGDLTVRGVTREVTFDLDFAGVSDDPWGGTRAGIEATTKINRKDFGLTWNVAVESGGVLVSDKIEIYLDIQLVKPTD